VVDQAVVDRNMPVMDQVALVRVDKETMAAPVQKIEMVQVVAVEQAQSAKTH
jgi:hypothetical protein